MKSTFILRIAMLSFFLTWLGFSNMENLVQAQTTLTDNLYVEPSGPFVSKDIASQRIDNSVTLYKILLENLTHSSPEYQQYKLKYDYAIAVQNFFINGKTVPESIVEGIRLFSAPDQYNGTKGTLHTLKLDMVNLLKA